MRLPGPADLVTAAGNAWDLLPLVGGGVADLTPLPSSIIAEGPQRTVRRFRARAGRGRRRPPCSSCRP